MAKTIIETGLGTVIFCDCLDKFYGLPNTRVVEGAVCITDPPYNLGYDNTHQNDLTRRRNGKEPERTDVVGYVDFREDYEEWTLKWFTEAKRICNNHVITFIGNRPRNMKLWLNMELPTEIHHHFKPNCASFTHIARFDTEEPILIYGDWDSFTFLKTCMNVPLENGFLRKDKNDESKTRHTSPKPFRYIDYLVERSKPTFVVDPFCGSGIICKSCEMRSIPYLCFEIDPDHQQDIEKNIAEGKALKPTMRKAKKLLSYGRNQD